MGGPRPRGSLIFNFFFFFFFFFLTEFPSVCLGKHSFISPATSSCRKNSAGFQRGRASGRARGRERGQDTSGWRVGGEKAASGESGGAWENRAQRQRQRLGPGGRTRGQARLGSPGGAAESQGSRGAGDLDKQRLPRTGSSEGAWG